MAPLFRHYLNLFIIFTINLLIVTKEGIEKLKER